MPPLPEDDYKVVLRPNGAINLTDVGPAIIVEAICIAASIDFRLALKEDQVRIHPIKNNITAVSTPDRLRAEAYRKITQLQHERNALSIPVAAYVPAPDNSVKGVIYKAHSYEDDQAIYEEVSRRNPDLPVGQEIDKSAPDSIPRQQGTTTKNKTAATWESRSKENNGGESRSRSESFPPLRGRSESRDRSESRPRRDHSSESRGERSTSRPRGNRSSSSHKQATSKGNKPAPQPRPKSPQDSQISPRLISSRSLASCPSTVTGPLASATVHHGQRSTRMCCAPRVANFSRLDTGHKKVSHSLVICDGVCHGCHFHEDNVVRRRDTGAHTPWEEQMSAAKTRSKRPAVQVRQPGSLHVAAATANQAERCRHFSGRVRACSRRLVRTIFVAT
ncbi:hypothetical protein HPB52_010088 [Rhipicephalus sanguineus]|uniref:Uncharacterized protein n=1 Tax=Rhipicephalus sanguineus TaxID=34632 RepID=A0A9D4PMC1_RHISA|nr:hypothetical protein HPB52_010088 [Rhipicephalus sanguineus]